MALAKKGGTGRAILTNLAILAAAFAAVTAGSRSEAAPSVSAGCAAYNGSTSGAGSDSGFVTAALTSGFAAGDTLVVTATSKSTSPSGIWAEAVDESTNTGYGPTTPASSASGIYVVTASTAGDSYWAYFDNTGTGAWTLSWTCIPAAASGDEAFTPMTAVTVSTPGRPLKSFDISYVDQGGVKICYRSKCWFTPPRYFLADRSNGAIDVIDPVSNTALSPLVPQLAFAGAVTVPTDSAGPNGVIMITGKVTNPTPPNCTIGCRPGGINFQQSMQNFVWATDAPSPSYLSSSIKVMDLDTGFTAAVLNTGGVRRADELCFNPDPKNPFVMVANDDPLDNYITIWRWDNFAMVGKISLAGSDPNAGPFNAHAPANGIEQCKFNPRNGYFYISIPATGSPTLVSPNIGDGYVLKISQPVMSTPTHVTTSAKVVAAYDITTLNAGCGAAGAGGGPAGLSIGPNSTTTTPPNGYIVLGCGKTGTGSVMIDDYGNLVAQIATAVGGTNAIDETWYDPFGNHFFLAGSGTGPGPGYLFIENAGGIPPAGSQEDGDAGTIGPDGGAGGTVAVFTGTGSHSVAVYSGTCKSPGRTSQVYVPIRSSLMTPNNSPTICSMNVPNGLGDDTFGCVAVYTAPNSCGPP
jgi:hypothetical protein